MIAHVFPSMFHVYRWSWRHSSTCHAIKYFLLNCYLFSMEMNNQSHEFSKYGTYLALLLHVICEFNFSAHRIRHDTFTCTQLSVALFW